ncbi:unnamed protein product [Pedinophyceae sp. YPF-701]|nr:unnamed protein product [Pedinophyceae sp. YPF-701]
MIRRRPPQGVGTQPCGPVDFKVPLDKDNEPRNILEEIVWYKDKEIRDYRERLPPPLLQAMIKANETAKPSRDFSGALRDMQARLGKPGLIAEVKKASPSKGVIQPDFDPVRIAQAYEAGGAACLSVLTDVKYFQGGFENLKMIREAGVTCPLLCKEFIVDAYQLMMARAHGADAVLLIAAVLPNKDLEYLIKVARTLKLQCLLEVHTVQEMDRMMALPSLEGCILGINNRDLGTFEVDLENTARIMESESGRRAQEQGVMVVGESGIFTPDHLKFIHDAGCGAALVGESLVKQTDAATGIRKLYELE